MRPEKYYEEVVKPKWGETLEILGLVQDEGLQLFLQYVILDTENKGEVCVQCIVLDSLATILLEFWV
jgi:hypothetical protein